LHRRRTEKTWSDTTNIHKQTEDIKPIGLSVPALALLAEVYFWYRMLHDRDPEFTKE